MNKKADQSERQNDHGESCSLQIVFADIVRYSKRRTKTQEKVIMSFTKCLRSALKKAVGKRREVAQPRKDQDFEEEIIKLPTGDGAAVTFQVGKPHDIHLYFAKTLLEEIHLSKGTTQCSKYERKRWCDCHPELFEVRIGVAEGKCIIYEDINHNKNVAGEPINTASRVMDVADGEQIIFTKHAYEDIVNLSPHLVDQFKEHNNVRIKRDFITVYQYLGTGETPYINSDAPSEVEDFGFVTPSNLKEALKPIGIKLDLLASSSGYQFLEGSDVVYAAVAETIKTAKENIQVVLLESRPEASSAVLRALADAVNNRGVRYDIVVVHNRDKPSAGFETNHDDLMELLTGVRGERHTRYHPFVLETQKPICFDTIIIDGEAVGLGFTHTEGGSELQHGIMLRDKNIGGKFAKWFENVVMSVVKTHGKEFVEWRKEKKAETDGKRTTKMGSKGGAQGGAKSRKKRDDKGRKNSRRG